MILTRSASDLKLTVFRGLPLALTGFESRFEIFINLALACPLIKVELRLLKSEPTASFGAGLAVLVGLGAVKPNADKSAPLPLFFLATTLTTVLVLVGAGMAEPTGPSTLGFFVVTVS